MSDTWIDRLSLSSQDREALEKIPKEVFEAFCAELQGLRVPCGLHNWYPQNGPVWWCGWCPVGNSGYSRLLAHQLMLSDELRVKAFKDALERVVSAGDIVVDVGTGTGILAFLACELGASKVIAIECDNIARLAKDIAAANGLGNKIHFIHGRAEDVAIPRKADVLVSECLGSGGVGTAQVRSVLIARQRLLRAGGIIIPQSVSVVVCPMEAILCDIAIRFWSSRPYNFNFAPAEQLARNLMYTTVLDAQSMLASPKTAFDLDCSRDIQYDGFRTQLHCEIIRTGIIHGIGIWFSSMLAESIVIDTSPGHPLTHWYQCYLPLQTPIPVQAGDHLAIAIGHRYHNNDSVWEWGASRIAARDCGVAIGYEQSTLGSVP